MAKKKKAAKKAVPTVKELLEHCTELELSIKALGKKLNDVPHGDPWMEGPPNAPRRKSE